MRWILIKREKNIFGLTIKTVKCSNCGNRETFQPGDPFPLKCYVCEQELEDDRMTLEQLENLWDSGYKKEIEDGESNR